VGNGPVRVRREARAAEDRQRDRTESAKTTCEGNGDLENRQAPGPRDWHRAAHQPRASRPVDEGNPVRAIDAFVEKLELSGLGSLDHGRRDPKLISDFFCAVRGKYISASARADIRKGSQHFSRERATCLLLPRLGACDET
jgi:hypothetical protein